jgi:Domain of unknown function (DUF4350)
MRKAAIGLSVVVVLAAVFLYMTRDRSYDRSFDTRVANPAYPSAGPVVLYDEGHRNTHTTSRGYKPFADLIRNDGYTLRTTDQPFTAQQLGGGVSVLVLVLAQGSNPTNDSAAYSDGETAAIAEWVREGGSLLLVADHWPFGLAARSLARRFDVDLSGGFAEDPKYHEPERGVSHLVFSEENGLLRAHPITRGVTRVLTFTGTSLQGPAGAVAFLSLSDSATDRPPGPARVEQAGGDTRVLMEYGDPRPARGRAQGIALEFGRGRVVVLGEAGMLRAERARAGLVGMNVPGYDNRQLALNIMHWLSRAP